MYRSQKDVYKNLYSVLVTLKQNKMGNKQGQKVFWSPSMSAKPSET